MADVPRSPLRRNLRAITGDGISFSLMVGFGETYLPAFVLAGGLGAVAAGWVATVPVLAGAVLQMVTPWAVHRLGSYRRWVVLCARIQAATFLPLIAGACLGSIRSDWLFATAACYWGFGMATSPAWNSWVTGIVPASIRKTFFARRARLSQLALLGGVIGAGLFLDLGCAGELPLLAFAAIFAVASAARFVSSLFLASQSERPGVASLHPPLAPLSVLRDLRASEGARLLAYLVGMQATVHVVAPFFTPYMLGPLALPYSGFMVLTGAAFLARIAALPFLARAAHRFGTRTVLRFGAIGIVPLPTLWLVSDEFAYLVGVQLLAGLVWAAVEYATQLSFFESLHERERTSVLTFFNLANTLAMVAGSLVGGTFFWLVGASRETYQILFVVSSAARLLPLFWLRRVPSPEIPEPGVTLRTLAVRPSLGAIQRPILASLEPAETETETDPP